MILADKVPNEKGGTMEQEYMEHAREELRMIAKDSDVQTIMRAAGISPADEVTLRTALELPLPDRLKGVSSNGSLPEDLMRRFIVAKTEKVYEAFQRYMRVRVDAEMAEESAGGPDAREQRMEDTAFTVRSMS